ncbi:MAG: hypothetical protein QM704_16245 [Anaeromyxobacteraceae bacterium]
MARKERVKAAAGVDRLEGLLAAGDHAGARREAARLQADAGAGEDARARAAGALASLAPERAALALGALSLLAAALIFGWLLTR